MQSANIVVEKHGSKTIYYRRVQSGLLDIGTFAYPFDIGEDTIIVIHTLDDIEGINTTSYKDIITGIKLHTNEVAKLVIDLDIENDEPVGYVVGLMFNDSLTKAEAKARYTQLKH